jgi:hypothetical protein
MAPILELRSVPNGGYHGGHRLRADPFDPGDPLAGLGRFEHALDLLVKGSDPPIEILEEVVELTDGLARQVCQLGALAKENLRDSASRPGDTHTDGDPTIEQQAPDLAHDGSAVVHQPLAGTVERLDVLFRGLVRGQVASSSGSLVWVGWC